MKAQITNIKSRAKTFLRCRSGQLVLGISIIVMGCAQLRPYVSSERGSMDMRVKTQLWDGNAIQHYYITASEEIINLGDSKEHLADILGHPDEAALSLEGYEIWVYRAQGVKFYFDDEGIKMIRNIDGNEL